MEGFQSGDTLFNLLENDPKTSKMEFSILFHAANQNSVPKQESAFIDFVEEVRRAKSTPGTNFKRYWLYEKDTSDPDDKLDSIYRRAESAYRRMVDLARALPLQPLASTSTLDKKISRIEYIENPRLEQEFLTTKQDFILSSIPHDEVYLFHGTNDDNIDSILENNFSLTFNPVHKVKAAAYGNGVYFSQFPTVSVSYGTLILCRVLPGRVQSNVKGGMSPNIPDEFDSRKIAATGSESHSAIHVIKKPAQILPHCVIRLKDLSHSGKAHHKLKRKSSLLGSYPHNIVLSRSSVLMKQDFQNPFLSNQPSSLPNFTPWNLNSFPPLAISTAYHGGTTSTLPSSSSLPTSSLLSNARASNAAGKTSTVSAPALPLPSTSTAVTATNSLLSLPYFPNGFGLFNSPSSTFSLQPNGAAGPSSSGSSQSTGVPLPLSTKKSKKSVKGKNTGPTNFP